MTGAKSVQNLRAPNEGGLARLIFGSLVIHLVLLVGGAVIAGMRDVPPKPREVIITKLVKLGKKRPKELMPRKAVPPPPPPPKAAPVETKAVSPAPAPPKVKNNQPVPKSQETSLSSLLDKYKATDEEPEGEEQGSKFGEVSVADRLASQRYIGQIYGCLKQNWFIEGALTQKIAGLSAVVAIRVNPKGKLVEKKLIEASGNATFDRAVKKALEQCKSVGAPPASELQTATNIGYEFDFKP